MQKEKGKNNTIQSDIKLLKVAVYDADNIPFYVCHNKKGEPEKTFDDCINLCDNLIFNTNNRINADYYVGFLTKGKCFRYDIYPEYKGNRKYDDPPKYLQEVKQYLIDGHNFTYQEGYEADDLVMSFKAQYKQYESIIVSADKDILKACNVAYNTRKNEFVYNSDEEIIEHFWKSMICGDTVDNIKGIPGKGEVYSEKLFQRFAQYGERYEETVFLAYLSHFGEYKGIQEFYKNYMCLKMVEDVQLKEFNLNEIKK